MGAWHELKTTAGSGSGGGGVAWGRVRKGEIKDKEKRRFLPIPGGWRLGRKRRLRQAGRSPPRRVIPDYLTN